METNETLGPVKLGTTRYDWGVFLRIRSLFVGGSAWACRLGSTEPGAPTVTKARRRATIGTPKIGNPSSSGSTRRIDWAINQNQQRRTTTTTTTATAAAAAVAAAVAKKKKRKKKEIKKKRGIAQKIRNSNLSDYSSGNDSYYWRHCFLLVSFFFVRLFRVSWPTSLLPSSLPFWPSSSSSLVSLWNRFSVLFVNAWVCVFFSLTKAFFIRLAGGQQKRRRKVASLNLHFHQPRFNAPFHGVIQIETRARWSPPTLPIDPWPLFMYRRVIRFVLLSSNGETRNRSSLAPLIIFDNRSNYGFFTVHLILKRDQFCYHSRWHPRQFEIS